MSEMVERAIAEIEKMLADSKEWDSPIHLSALVEARIRSALAALKEPA